MTAPVLILAGGTATRLRPVTEKIPKAMLEVGGRPFIEHQLSLLARNGVRRAIICAGYLGDQIQAFVDDGSRFGLSAEFVQDGETLRGTGGAVKNAARLAGDVFFVMYGDSYLTEPFAPVEDYFLRHGKQALMTVYENNGLYDTSNIVFRDGSIAVYDKKNLTPEMRWIDYGLCMFRREVFDTDRFGDRFDLSQLLGELVGRGEVLGWQVKERFYEIGSFAGLEETSRLLAKGG